MYPTFTFSENHKYNASYCYFFNASLISINKISVLDGPDAAISSFFFILLYAFTTKKSTNATIKNLITAAIKFPYFTTPQVRLDKLVMFAAFRAGCSKKGVITSSTSEDIMAEKAAPSTTATASSIILPFTANDLNSVTMPMEIDFFSDNV